MSTTIEVKLDGSAQKDRSYNIVIERGLLDSMGARISELGLA